MEGQQDMTYLEEYLEITPDRIRVKGHRIGLEQIVRAYNNGATAEDIARDFPGLPLESIYAALTYYLRNQTMVETYMAEKEAEAEKAYAEWAVNPPAVVRRLRATRTERSTPEV